MEAGMVSVDRWTHGSQVYFLTHIHSDHTKGLSSTWKLAPLYCSRITAKLFPSKFPGFNLSLLRIVETGVWYSLSLIAPSSNSLVTVKAMAIDAQHCPGAVMYLFQGEFGCMLYTGDFRWERTSKKAQFGKNMLLNALRDKKIDNLYLDNTYCNPSFMFPSREVAAQQVVDIIASNPDHDIIIGIDSLGKEELLLNISRVLKTKIWVWPERLQTMHLLGLHGIFTTKTSVTRVRAVPRYSFSIDTLEGLNLVRPTIGIMPSGLPWALKWVGENRDPLQSSSRSVSRGDRINRSSNIGSYSNIEMPNMMVKSFERYHKYMYAVPYSDHACFAEIQEFIELLQPDTIKGIVSSSPSYVDPHYYFSHLCRGIQPSCKYQKLERPTERKKDEELHTKYNFGSKKFVGAASEHRRIRPRALHSREGCVSILRRERRGVKILETDCKD
ncbi:5' exonuclease Apollo [Heracleum sosnowskyi]|uniref:5' exonuclease Apollo n=1 Tax=Heracleum sosnowskyi TaxID=360622 RepID=A0AAD8IPX1_9APIA|nr:5' exonuclease Apollo [Heracleum sosnowskyi]